MKTKIPEKETVTRDRCPVCHALKPQIQITVKGHKETWVHVGKGCKQEYST